MLELDQISLNGIIFLFSELQEKTVSDSDIFPITRIETFGENMKNPKVSILDKNSIIFNINIYLINNFIKFYYLL